jgi:hypothetical protein
MVPRAAREGAKLAKRLALPNRRTLAPSREQNGPTDEEQGDQMKAIRRPRRLFHQITRRAAKIEDRRSWKALVVSQEEDLHRNIDRATSGGQNF